MICALSAEQEDWLEADQDVARLRGGDADALGELIARYQHRLYRYLLRLSGDPATAEDLFQQTWLRVMEKIGKYDLRGNFEAWLFAVARNLTIDHLRRKRPESLDEPRESGEPVQHLHSNTPSALEQCLKSERIAKAMSALAELPAVYREVLTLRFEEEMKLEEIAELIEAPLATVKSRLRRGLLQLRERISE